MLGTKFRLGGTYRELYRLLGGPSYSLNSLKMGYKGDYIAQNLQSYMSYGLNLGCGGPIGELHGVLGGHIKGYTTNLGPLKGGYIGEFLGFRV